MFFFFHEIVLLTVINIERYEKVTLTFERESFIRSTAPSAPYPFQKRVKQKLLCIFESLPKKNFRMPLANMFLRPRKSVFSHILTQIRLRPTAKE